MKQSMEIQNLIDYISYDCIDELEQQISEEQNIVNSCKILLNQLDKLVKEGKKDLTKEELEKLSEYGFLENSGLFMDIQFFVE